MLNTIGKSSFLLNAVFARAISTKNTDYRKVILAVSHHLDYRLEVGILNKKLSIAKALRKPNLFQKESFISRKKNYHNSKCRNERNDLPF